MAVFSILAVALLYRGTSAQCAGVSAFGIPVSPLNVCVDSSSSGIITSAMFSCSNNAGYIDYYSGAGCSGTLYGSVPVTNVGLTAECSGEVCDYAIQRQYDNGTDVGTCSEDYTETAVFVGECVSFGAAAENSCTSSSIITNTYASADCSGDAVNSQDVADSPCVEVISCSTDGSDPDSDDDDDDDDDEDDDEPTACAGYYLYGVALSPLDVCLNNETAAGEVTSSKYTCNNNVGVHMTYDAADCSGTGESVSFRFGESIVCDGELCSYAVSKSYGEGAEEGQCTEAYQEGATFTNRCFAIAGYSMATCSGSSATYSTYASADCSGTATNISNIADDACTSILECNDFGSSASVPAALLAMAISVIALIA